ncbi:MAG: DUF2868 domain-containing protein, partial [Xanthomonadaceae bacterium]|nr:DUF2868 domain-containing protein [Xanthomonadaceae bacterium]
IDTARPGYLRLAGALTAEGDIRVQGRRPTADGPPHRQRPAGAAGPVLLVGVELERSDWPVPVPGLEWRALGRADTRSQRTELLAAVESLSSPPPAILAQCSALRTPDEGTGRFLSALADAAGTVLMIWLDEGERWRERGAGADDRRADWCSLAERIGAELVELDADAPDSDAMAAMIQALGPSP